MGATFDTIQTVLFVFESILTEVKHYHSAVVLRIEFLRSYFKKCFLAIF